MANIKFNYLYRDGGNYKNYSFVIFENPDDISLDYLHEFILSKLFEETWFYVDKWKVPDLHFGTWDNELDHTFHEFESLEYCEGVANAFITLKDFIEAIRSSKNLR